MIVLLRLLDEAAAELIIAGRCPYGYRGAPDFPADADRIAARLFLERVAAGVDPRPYGAFLVCLAVGPRPRAAGRAEAPLAIGGIGFHGGVDGGGRVEIGYGIVPSQQGRGYATEALRLLIAVAEGLGARILSAETETANLASQGVLRRHGFVQTAGVASTLCFELALPRR